MRRRMIALAVAALLTVAGCDAAFGGGTRCRDKGGRDQAPQEQTSDQSADL